MCPVAQKRDVMRRDMMKRDVVMRDTLMHDRYAVSGDVVSVTPYHVTQ